jgi:hypothetical protein
MLRIFLFGLAKRRKQPERYAKYRPEIFFTNFTKELDKGKKIYKNNYESLSKIGLQVSLEVGGIYEK